MVSRHHDDKVNKFDTEIKNRSPANHRLTYRHRRGAVFLLRGLKYRKFERLAETHSDCGLLQSVGHVSKNCYICGN